VKSRIIVIGGGVTGLCAGHYLQRAYGPDQVLVLEAGSRAGGQSGTTRADGFVCDWGPNGFLDREPLTLQWVDDLGLAGELRRANAAAAHRFILRDGRLQEVPLSPPAFLRSRLLSLRGRMRVLCEPWIPRRTDPTAESLWHFAARRIGREAADFMIDPMASGIFGGDAKRLALTHCFPKMAEMEAQYGSLFRAMRAKKRQKKTVSAAGPAGTLTSFAEGIGHLCEVAADRLGDCLVLHTPVTNLVRLKDGYRVETDSDSTFKAHGVVVALPAYAASELTSGLDAPLSAALAAIPYAGIVVLCTGYRREKVKHNLNGFGFVAPRNQGVRVLGCIWTSSVFAGRAPDGWVQLRTMYGGATDSDAVNLSDRALLDLLHHEVEPLLQIDGSPEFVQIHRWPRGIPQYTLDHGDRLAAVEAAERRYPGLAFAGNAYRGVGLNDCVVSAHRAVEILTATPGLTPRD
jgi:oxygen-dependent protoporphyrinogen oxidase